MLFTPATLSDLAHCLTLERKRQGLSRAQAAAVCNVSSSFIRDAETEPARCSLGRLSQYMAGLGLSLDIAGWSPSALESVGRESAKPAVDDGSGS